MASSPTKTSSVPRWFRPRSPQVSEKLVADAARACQQNGLPTPQIVKQKISADMRYGSSAASVVAHEVENKTAMKEAALVPSREQDEETSDANDESASEVKKTQTKKRKPSLTPSSSSSNTSSPDGQALVKVIRMLAAQKKEKHKGRKKQKKDRKGRR